MATNLLKDVAKFYLYLKRQKYASTTIEKYCQYYNRFFLETYEGLISKNVIDHFIDKHNNQAIRSFLKVLIKYYELKPEEYPIPLIKGRLKKINLESKILTPKEIELLIMALGDLEPQVHVLLMYEGGLRVSELLPLKVANFRFDDNKVVVLGKGNKERMINYSEQTKDLILELCKGKKIDEFVFDTRCRQTIWKRVKKAGKKVLGRSVHPHLFRHSCGARLIKNNISLRIIQDYLGHESISTTQIYTQLERGQIDTAWNKSFNNYEDN